LRSKEKPGTEDKAALETPFREGSAACNHCHAKYHDSPQPRP
jgi:hypothetical protein